MYWHRVAILARELPCFADVVSLYCVNAIKFISAGAPISSCQKRMWYLRAKTLFFPPRNAYKADMEEYNLSSITPLFFISPTSHPIKMKFSTASASLILASCSLVIAAPVEDSSLETRAVSLFEATGICHYSSVLSWHRR